MSWKTETRLIATLLTVALFLTLGVSAASAQQTLMMPDRDAMAAEPVVVWGNTSEGAGPVTISFGDGSPDATPAFNAGSQSYIATVHTYALADLGGAQSKDFTVTLTVGASSGSATVTVWDPAQLTAPEGEEEEIRINIAIENGLRYLYFSTNSRESRHDAQTPAGWVTASWSFHGSFTSMAALAFENHQYPATGGSIYAPLVQGALNYLFAQLATQVLTVEPAGDPCVPGVPAILLPCNGLRPTGAGPVGYSTAVVTLAIAGSGSPGATVGAGLGAGAGQSYKEVVQRLVNTIAWGPGRSNRLRNGRLAVRSGRRIVRWLGDRVERLGVA